MFFLSVVLMGTVYPIFLEVVNNDNISVGPSFYHKSIVPFLIPFLIFMAIGPNLNWIKDKINKINLQQLLFFILSIIVSFIFLTRVGISYLFSLPLFIASFFLFFITFKYFSVKKSTLS